MHSSPFIVHSFSIFGLSEEQMETFGRAGCYIEGDGNTMCLIVVSDDDSSVTIISHSFDVE